MSTVTSLIPQLVAIVEDILGLVTVFPINICLAAGLIGIGFKIVRKAKGAANV